MASILDSIMAKLAKGYIGMKSKKRLANHSGSLDIPQLSEPVEIRHDAQGVPYIYAKNRKDLFLAQGFVHAQDRLWQLDLNRRVATGRLSEILGKDALPTDRLSRTLGFDRLGKLDYTLIDDDLRACVKAYCDGINAYLKHPETKLPIEFSLLKYQPDPWKVSDIMAFTRVMTLQLSHGWGHEIARASLIELLGPEIAGELDMRYASHNPATLPDGVERNRILANGKLEAMNGPYMHQRGGSNAWAVAGSKTDTGMPYLCNDPHLSSTMPSIWYQIYMESPDFRVQGVSIPGMPFVMIGHNQFVSWGVTLAFTDIQDVFIEEFEPGSKYRYRFKDEWVNAEVIQERILVKGEEPYMESVVITRNGPILSHLIGLPEAKGPENHYALKSPALQPSRLTMGWRQMDTARNWDEFLDALRHIDAPGLNIVYADVKGNIGYWVTGKTPIRAKGKGEVPRPGKKGEYDWLGTVPFEEMPHALNPERGWLVSANNKVVNDDFPYFMGNVWMNGYRAKRIENLLEEKKKWSRDDFFAIHKDLYCEPGKILGEIYAETNLQLTPGATKALGIWLKWDGMLTVDSIAGAIYQVTKKRMFSILLVLAGAEDKNYDSLVGKGGHPVFFKATEFQGKEANALFDLLNKPDSKVLGMAGGKAQVMKQALEEAVVFLKGRFGEDMSTWQWGKLHQLRFSHAMSVKKPLDKVFDVGPVPVPGDSDTVYQTSMQAETGYLANLASPSYRQVIDLQDFNRSLWVKPPGQSGQVASVNQDDQFQTWLDGEYFPMVWDRKQVEKITVSIQNLVPFMGE